MFSIFSDFPQKNEHEGVTTQKTEKTTEISTSPITRASQTYDYSSTDMGELGDVDEFSGSEKYNEEYYLEKVSNVMDDIYKLYKMYRSVVKEELTKSKENENISIPNYYVENGI